MSKNLKQTEKSGDALYSDVNNVGRNLLDDTQSVISTLGENISSGARYVVSEAAQGVQTLGSAVSDVVTPIVKPVTDIIPESVRQIPSNVYQGGKKVVTYVLPRKDQVKKILNILILIAVIVLIGVVVYLTCVRYRLVGTALSANDRPLAAALLTPEIATGVTTLAGML
jgi:hypothetical protein